MSKNYKNLALFSGIAGLAWLGLSGSIALLQKKLIFKPEHDDSSPVRKSEDVRVRSIVIHADSQTRLSGYLITPRTIETIPAVIYFGGRSEDVSWLRQDAEKLFPGFIVLAVNYRGYGRSSGIPSEENIIRDAFVTFDWLTAKSGVDPETIMLVGRSLGSGVAIQVAAKRKAKALVLITPYDSIVAIAKRRFPIVPSFFLRHKFDSTKFAPSVKCPILVLRAQEDNVVPHEHTDRLIVVLEPKPQDFIIENSNHSTIPFTEKCREEIRRFFKQHNQKLGND